MSPSPSEVGAEEIVVNAVLWLAVETVGALVIAAGMLLAGWSFVAGFPPVVVTFAIGALSRNCARISLGPDILSTAVAPSWHAIGKLAAVAIIRTLSTIFSAVTCKKPTRRHAKLRSQLSRLLSKGEGPANAALFIVNFG